MPDSSSTDVIDARPVVLDSPQWTPICRGQSRILRAREERAGSMQHFHSVLLLAEAVLKLHTAVAVSLVGNFEQGTARQLGFDLIRTSGSGLWTAAVRSSMERLSKYHAATHNEELASWLLELNTWLLRKRKRGDADVLAVLLGDLRAFRAELAQSPVGAPPSSPGTPLEVIELLVEVRNKTTAHGGYSADFYEAHIPTVDIPTQWLIGNTPLWQSDLAVSLNRGGQTLARCLRGSEPTKVFAAPDTIAAGRSICLLPGGSVQELVPLIEIDVSDNQTYLANGSWRDSDSTAEFLCHSLEAQLPGQGKRRVEAPDYAIRPAAAPPSDTEELGALKLEAGVAPHNLPLATASYVPRPYLEDRLRPILRDTQRRHLVTVRGHGGIGKTSLTLALCHELVLLGSDCPYDAVIWLSARDVDLTARGPKDVRRSTGTIEDVWERVAELFDAGSMDSVSQKDFFEERLREDNLLLVLDNFETFDAQQETYEYLDSVTYPPSKVLITSRHDFQSDTTVRVDSMAWPEADAMLVQAAREASLEPLLTESVRRTIFDRCKGHPYAMRLAAVRLRTRNVAAELPTVLRDEQLLEALFRSSIADLGDDDEALFVFLLVGQFPRGLSLPALQVVPGGHDIDLDSAIKELGLRSLLEVQPEDLPWSSFDMPAMAREFARKLVSGHVLNTEVTAATKFVQAFPGLDRGALLESAAAMFRDVRDGTLTQDELAAVLAALEKLAEFDARLWVTVARAKRAAKRPESDWNDAYKRAVEENPGRADVLWEWSDATANRVRRIELKVQAVVSDPTNVALASRAALILNTLYARERSLYTQLRWRALLRTVCEVMEEHFEDLDAPALSRLAWMYLHAGEQRRANRAVARGQEVDPDNPDIDKLVMRRTSR